MFDRATVDSVKFAYDSSELHGVVATADLPRLQDVLFDRSGEVTYTLTGFVNTEGRPSLRLAVAGALMLRCQRCLGPARFLFDTVRDFTLVPAGEALSDPAEEVEEEVEQIHADQKLDVIALVEDEVILGLPMVVGHDAGTCVPPVPEKEGGKKQSPFSVLAGLKRQ